MTYAQISHNTWKVVVKRNVMKYTAVATAKGSIFEMCPVFVLYQ